MTLTRNLAGAFHDAGRVAAVRASIAVDGAAGRLSEHLAARQRALRDDGERGAQAAEYAMLGGVAAAGCGTMVVVLQEQQDELGSQIGEWISRIFSFAGQFLGS